MSYKTHNKPWLAEESSRALADQLGITYRQLADWLDKGLVSPRHVGVGRGNTRVLTPTEIARVRYLAALTHEYENVFGKQGRPDGGTHIDHAQPVEADPGIGRNVQ